MKGRINKSREEKKKNLNPKKKCAKITGLLD